MLKLKDRVVPFEFVPFSQKQSIVMSWWTPNSRYKDFDAIICDGAVRSGKTVSEALSLLSVLLTQPSLPLLPERILFSS